MARRLKSRRSIAAGLRRAAALALRAAQALAAAEPEPAQTAASGGSEPARVPGPPEHWRALVAARAPALLRGEGIGLRRGPAGAVPGVRPVAVPPLGPVAEPGPPAPVSGAPQRPRWRRRVPPPDGSSTPAPAAPTRPVVRVRPQPSPAPGSTPETSGSPAPAQAPAVRAVPAGPAPSPTASAGYRPVPDSTTSERHRPAPGRIAAGEPGRVVEAPHSHAQPERRADEDRAAARAWPPLPQQEPVAHPPEGQAAPVVPYPDMPAVAVPVITVHRRGAARLDPGPDRLARPRLAEPARPEPDPWPDLPDDSPLWTLPPLAYDAERVRRLEREQAGR